jgi:hypothetical protein
MPELPYTALPTPATPIGHLKTWRLVLRCARCNRKVVLALTDLAAKHGPRVPVWRVIDRLWCHKDTGWRTLRQPAPERRAGGV